MHHLPVPADPITQISHTMQPTQQHHKQITAGGIEAVIFVVVLLIKAVVVLVAILKILSGILGITAGHHTRTTPNCLKALVIPTLKRPIINHSGHHQMVTTNPLIQENMMMALQEDLLTERHQLGHLGKGILQPSSVLPSSPPSQHRQGPNQRSHRNSMRGLSEDNNNQRVCTPIERPLRLLQLSLLRQGHVMMVVGSRLRGLEGTFPGRLQGCAR